MVSKLMTVAEAAVYAKRRGIKGVISYGGGWYKIQVGKGRWRQVSGNTLVYHRGKGIWSIYSEERDKKKKSKQVKDPGVWKRQRHKFDLFGQVI